ncbi:MAG: ABC transporter substrate-binding protein [Candidatus Bathyarchaeota archaeon]
MLDSEALTKIQSIVVVVIIVVAGLTGFILYHPPIQSDTIKIGVCADLDMLAGSSTYQGVVLAAEQINNEGGVLGKQIEVVAEDSDGNSPNQDIKVGTTALIKLLKVDKVDFIISSDQNFMKSYQEIIAEHEKILFCTAGLQNELTQRVSENYQKYKYFFRTLPNATHALLGTSDCLATLREYSSFNKVAILSLDISTWTDLMAILTDYLPQNFGFEIVYHNKFPFGTIDFSSYLSAVEESGAEILIPFLGSEEGIILVKEWYDRQSPFVLWGMNVYVTDPNAWEQTEGKCEYSTNVGFPTVAGYPLTKETIPFRDAYTEKYGVVPNSLASISYDTIRFILFDALKRAKTIETQAVIEALEKTKIETSLARNFVFTENHDVLGGENINNPDEDLMVVMLFQWQNGKQVPVYPKKIMEEAGATYLYPPWAGPWED